METINNRINRHFASLSKKQKNIASFILNHMQYIGTHSAAEVGEKAGTSETTVIRFCYAIGLEGYAHLQKEITLYLFNQTSSISSLGNYVSHTRGLIQDQDFIEKTISKDIYRIGRIAKQIDMVQFSNATQKLHEAKHIYITAGGASKYASEWFRFTLSLLRPNVSTIPMETPELIRTMKGIDQQSLVVVISQHRYTKEPIQIAELLYNKGIEVIGITDSSIAPIHQFCHIAFVLEQLERSTIDLMPALISFLNVLITGMMTVDPVYYEEQRVNFDVVQHEFITDRWS